MKYEEEFRRDHPETIGEKDAAFDRSNYCDWLEEKTEKLTEKGRELMGIIKAVEIESRGFGSGVSVQLYDTIMKAIKKYQ